MLAVSDDHVYSIQHGADCLSTFPSPRVTRMNSGARQVHCPNEWVKTVWAIAHFLSLHLPFESVRSL